MSLSKTSLGMATVVGQALTKRGVQLQAVNDTPLAALVGLSTQQLQVEASLTGPLGNFERSDIVTALESDADAAIPGTNVSAHSQQLGESVEMLGRVLTNIHNLAQNVVNPTIDRVVKSIGEHIDAAQLAGVSPLSIVQQRPDPILDSVYLRESVSRYAGTPREFSLRGFPALVRPHAGSLLQTGHAGMDEQLTAFLGRVGEDYAAQVFADVFISPPAGATEIYSRPSQTDKAVLVYFFAAKLLQEIPEGLNVSLSEWQSYVSGILASAGSAIAASYDERAKRRQYGTIVLSCPEGDQPVGNLVVDGDKYDQFVAAGGTPELIFAEAYSTKNFDGESMLTKVEPLTARWAQVQALYQGQVAIKRFDAMIAGARKQITTEINDLGDDQLPPGCDKGALHDILNERMSHAKMRDLEDLWHFARKAVCRVLFFHTEAESLLLAIDQESKTNPETPVRELALFATIEIVARWLVDQMAYTDHQAA